MIELMLPQLSAAALLAVAGAAHCVGMCGGIGTALTFTVPAARREGLRLWGWQLLFGVGRIGGYAALGAVAGGLGNGLLRVLPWQGPAWPALFSGALMLLLSIHFLTGGGLLRRLERTGAVVWRRLQPLVRRLLPVDRPAKALMLGALWGFLPCGLVYSALLLAASSASVVGGLLVMTVFGGPDPGPGGRRRGAGRPDAPVPRGPGTPGGRRPGPAAGGGVPGPGAGAGVAAPLGGVLRPGLNHAGR
ncbi:hypothetical protein SAMN06272769_1349 [Alcanivorax sp. DSM 26295]|nr:hypothetical protein SAMN06272769_1349 [Alcanivorax sp. DSM 26295]